MIDGIIGKKLGMTSIFTEDGRMVPVTVIQAGPVTVMQIKTGEKEGYCAVQLGFEDKKLQRATKPEVGHARKGESGPKKVLKELRVSPGSLEGLSQGQELTLADVGLEAEDLVNVSGISIGKGFAGVMKRHNFGGSKATHGVHEYKRHAGAIGQCADPSRVFKGKKMAGQMGAEKVTVKNLKIAEVRPEENLVLVKGSVPGHKNGVVMIKLSKKRAKEAA